MLALWELRFAGKKNQTTNSNHVVQRGLFINFILSRLPSEMVQRTVPNCKGFLAVNVRTGILFSSWNNLDCVRQHWYNSVNHIVCSYSKLRHPNKIAD